MKNIFTNFKVLLLIGMVLFVGASQNVFAQTISTSNLPSITSISPAQGTAAKTLVTIYGTKLSGTTNIEFSRSGVLSRVVYPTSVSETSVVFALENYFYDNIGVYQINVVTNKCAGGCTSNKVDFKVISSNNTVTPITPKPPTTIQLPPNNGNGGVVGGDDDDNNNEISCVDLKNNLRLRSTDARNNGEVTLLQNFLKSDGYLNIQPSGFFGKDTFKAVQSFQKASGLRPTGFVGQLTRAKIKALTCDEG